MLLGSTTKETLQKGQRLKESPCVVTHYMGKRGARDSPNLGTAFGDPQSG